MGDVGNYTRMGAKIADGLVEFKVVPYRTMFSEKVELVAEKEDVCSCTNEIVFIIWQTNKAKGP